MSKRPRTEDDPQVEPTSVVQKIECKLGQCIKHPVVLGSYPEYELHIQTLHTHICQACKKCFPSHNFLSIHIEENHDPFFQIKKDRGEKVFRCLDNYLGCKKVCSNKSKRRLHMIDKHGYPRDFKFNIIDQGHS